ncbi:hypothetical protein [Nocardia sp. NPDC051750]|uniref:hypothetical protein n=1 Tax=Nocardia sp. NPDC051750 TaxID=3364325 RepID=UPI0037881604
MNSWRPNTPGYPVDTRPGQRSGPWHIPQARACVAASGLGTRPDMNTPNPDPRTAADLEDEPDFAEEHAEPTHADEHPVGEVIETDESTPRGSSGMD